MTVNGIKPPTGIHRLRSAHSAAKLAEIYARPHDHRLYGRGHSERVEETIRLGQRLIDHLEMLANEPAADVRYPISGADLSCGNGLILHSLSLRSKIFGDFAPPIHDQYSDNFVAQLIGPIEKTVQAVQAVDIFVCSETIEHLDNPASVLYEIRSAASWLLLSTPIDCWNDTNLEHYWAWSKEGVELLADRAGWTPWAYSSVDSTAYGEPYTYGIWVFQ